MCKLPSGDRHVSFPVEQAVIPITHPGKGKYMTKENDTCTALMDELGIWLHKRTVDINKFLAKPSSFDGMDDVDRKRAELNDRTQAAEKIVSKYLHKDVGFTAILSKFCNLKASQAVSTYCSAIREVLKDIQEKGRMKHDSSRMVKAELVSA
jgi:hypothetical protein